MSWWRKSSVDRMSLRDGVRRGRRDRIERAMGRHCHERSTNYFTKSQRQGKSTKLRHERSAKYVMIVQSRTSRNITQSIMKGLHNSLTLFTYVAYRHHSSLFSKSSNVIIQKDVKRIN